MSTATAPTPQRSCLFGLRCLCGSYSRRCCCFTKDEALDPAQKGLHLTHAAVANRWDKGVARSREGSREYQQKFVEAYAQAPNRFIFLTSSGWTLTDRCGCSERNAYSTRGSNVALERQPARLACSRTVIVVWVMLGVVGRALGWKDCSISQQDKWKQATDSFPAVRMRKEYDRALTCTTSKEGSFMAARYYFDSPCLAKKFFYPSDVRECLKGRRVIFLGDSLSNQQGDSLVGMLGWHPDWMPKGGPRNKKWEENEDGTRYFTLLDCWHPPEGSIRGIERCYDLYEADFPPAAEASNNPREPSLEGRIANKNSSLQPVGFHTRRNEDTISVHMRMTGRPDEEHWLEMASRDYNETRPSDIYIVNFAMHYPNTRDEDETFKRDVFPLLEDMAKLGETATVIWREISPTHFPGQNGTFEAFLDLNLGNTACCTGTPPKVLDRNLWVENYLQDNGLSDRVKILRIYDMSLPRGAAHRTCNIAPPSTMDQAGAASDRCHSTHATDCMHWSETGVVEEWNTLLLNHICPME